MLGGNYINHIVFVIIRDWFKFNLNILIFRMENEKKTCKPSLTVFITFEKFPKLCDC